MKIFLVALGPILERMKKIVVRMGIVCLCLVAPFKTAIADELDDAKVAVERRDYKTALALVKPLADSGNPRAMRSLGVLYLEGAGVPQDDKEGVRLITAASDAGDAKAQAILSWLITLHLPESGLSQSDEQAFSLAMLSVAQGDSFGKAVAGRALTYAIGTSRDMDRALRLLEDAASENEKMGQVILGELLLLGIGTPKDSQRGKVLLEAVAKQSNDKALMLTVGKVLKHESKLQDWLNGSLRISSISPMAAGLNLRLMTKLAKLQRWPALAALVIDVDDEEDLSYFYLALAAEKVGYLKAAQEYYKIALNPRLYGRPCAGIVNNCDGVDVRSESIRNIDRIALELRELDRLAAVKKAEEAEKKIQAEIVAAEERRRQELASIESAARAGDGDAQYRLALPLLTGDQSSADVESGMRWLRKAAANDVAKAQFELGIRLKAGKGVKKNGVEAERWFNRAAALGNADAKEALEELAVERRVAAAQAEAATKKSHEAKRAAELKAAEERAEQEAARKRENAQKLRTL